MTTEREHRAQLAWWIEHSTPETAEAIRWMLSALDSARRDGVLLSAALDRANEENAILRPVVESYGRAGYAMAEKAMADAAACRDAGDGVAAHIDASPAESPTGDTQRAADITLGVPPYQHQPPKPEPGDAEWGHEPDCDCDSCRTARLAVGGKPAEPTPPKSPWVRGPDSYDGKPHWQRLDRTGRVRAVVWGGVWHTFGPNGAGGENDIEADADMARGEAEKALERQGWADDAPPTPPEPAGGFDVEAARRQCDRLWTVLGIDVHSYSLYPAALKEVERLTARAEAAERQLADCRVMHAGAVAIQHGAEDRVDELERQLAEARGALKAVSEDSTDNVTYGLKCSLTRCRGCDRKRKMAAEAWHSSAPAQPEAQQPPSGEKGEG